MKLINTSQTTISKIKSNAKKLKKDLGITLSEALEKSAKDSGYSSFHHASVCFTKTKRLNLKQSISSIKLRVFDREETVRIEYEDDESISKVTDELDDYTQNFFYGMDEMSYEELNNMIKICEKLVKKEPAFIDGYAHLVGGLVTMGHHKDAINLGEPIMEGLLELFKTAPKGYLINYYELANRPFFRLAHHVVLAYYGDQKNDKARKLAKCLLKLWPNDNIGFRFLLTPPVDD
ncbi:MAG: hypothetical protein PHG15_00710 [Acinetobacter sp.]|uniref:hypothetical protein n=1 Tax=Acinetobacter sp. TaxID=472 RepID=UPI00261E6C88|nr:hypothetical protein [Acinetobacter sp.]MDD2944339.1 hypothetical protein [Acinetobacter sp.]